MDAPKALLSDKNLLKDGIQKGKIDVVIKILSELSVHQISKETERDISQCTARYHELSKQVRQGTISKEQESIERNRIRVAVLQVIEELPQQPYEVSEHLVSELKIIEEQKGGQRIWWIIIMLTVIIVIIAGLYTWISSCNNNDGSGYQPTEEPSTYSIKRDSNTPKTYTQDDTQKKKRSISQEGEKSPKDSSDPLVELVTKDIEFYPYTAQAIIDRDTYPLAYIDDAYLKGKEKQAKRVFDACVFDFSIENNSEETVMVNNIYARVEEHTTLPKYELIQELSFQDATVAYILMRQELKEYPVLFYLKNDERKELGKITLEPRGKENIAVRINAKEKGLYTFSCFARIGNGEAEQHLELIKPTQWVFDERE